MHGRYDSVEFDSVEYLATSGGLGQLDSNARIAYYGGNAMPHLLFNGGSLITGAGTNAIDGSVYDPIVLSMLDDATPLKMSIDSYSLENPGAFITVDLELEGALANPASSVLRVAVLEDGLSFSSVDYDNVLRDVLPDQALTISAAGETQQITVNYTPDVGWVTGNLRLVAFVQDDVTKEVIQSCNTRRTPDYSLRYYATGVRTAIDSGVVGFDDCAVFNAGVLEDTYDITLDTSALPAGWSANFSYDSVAYTSTSITLAPDARALFNVEIDAANTGEGQVILTFHSQSGLTADRSMSYKVITPDIKILLVDDDGAEVYDSLYFGPAIASYGKPFATWDRSSSKVSDVVLSNFDVVVWECALSYPTIDADDRAALGSYLDGGGNLFITGQDIGWELSEEGGLAARWYGRYLHATYVADDTNMLMLTGIDGDPITDGMSFRISGGDGANNQEYPSDIDPSGAGATTILTYDATRNGGIKADTGVHKVVYLSFGFEGIADAADREALMQNVLSWMLGTTPVDDTLPAVQGLFGNTPNPFNPKTAVHYSVASDTHVQLEVYDIKGRLIRVLEDGKRSAGEHSVVWDGNDDSGHAVSSGTYFARFHSSGKTESTKMMLVR